MKKLLAVLLFVPAMAHAEFWSGNDLYSKMNSTEMTDRIQSLGYVMGIYDMGVYGSFCPRTEQGITAGQLRDMAHRYLEMNPNQRHRPADRLLSEMFKQVWPCPNRIPGRGA